MGNAPDPHVYDYYRIRFLLGGGPKLLQLGKHLLKVDPNDLDVRIKEISYLTDLRSAISEANNLKISDPHNSRFYALLANLYTSAWIKWRDEDDRLNALGATRDFINSSSPLDKRLDDARYWLKILSVSSK